MADRAYGYDPVGAGAGGPVNQQAYRMEAGQLWRQYVIAGIGMSSAYSVHQKIIKSENTGSSQTDTENWNREKKSKILAQMQTETENWNREKKTKIPG